jgi:uncharacterized protein YndB with AHSA1/START domain
MVVPRASMDLRVGGKFRIQMRMTDGEFFTAVGVFREVKAPMRLVYTWDWEKDGSGADFGEVEGKPSLVTVEFLKRGERTEFVLTHSRFTTVESRDNHARGWGVWTSDAHPWDKMNPALPKFEKYPPSGDSADPAAP